MALTFPKVFEGLCNEPLGFGAGGLGVHGLGALAGVEGVGGAGFGDGDSFKRKMFLFFKFQPNKTNAKFITYRALESQSDSTYSTLSLRTLIEDGDATAPAEAPVGDNPAAAGDEPDDGPGVAPAAAAAVPAPGAVGEMSMISSSNRFRLMARELRCASFFL